AFKTQLFRFVDVFPGCRDDDDVMRHLQEYFDGRATPAPLRLGLGIGGKVPFGAGVAAATARRNIHRMARQFIAGQSAAEALPRLEELWRAGEASTVDLLGEKTLTSAEADRYAARVLEVLETLAGAASSWPAQPILESDPWGPLARVNISVKATALAPRFGPLTRAEGLDEARSRLRPVLLRARDVPATIHIDTEHDDVKDLTFELVRALGDEFPDGPALGCVVQAYRKDSYADLRDLVAWSKGALRIPLQIRLVKGAYWDYETVVARAEGWPVPVFEEKAQTDANYERCVRHLIDSAGAVRPAFASHNLRSLAYGLAAARAAGLPDGAVELQMLYGMAEPMHAALRSVGQRLRVYAPVGELVPGMAYLVRRLLENTSNESFLRHRFAEGRELRHLVRPPKVKERDLPDAAPEALARPETDPAHPTPFENEPPAELRRITPRARLMAAVGATPARLGFEAPVTIAGKAVRSREEIVSVDPGAYDTVVCRSGRAGSGEVEAAVAAASAAGPEWRGLGFAGRAAVLFKAAALLRARKAELAALMVFEAGKPIREADADVAEAIDFCEYYGREARRLGAGVPIPQAPGETNSNRYQPRGMGGVFAPWNLPRAIPCGMVTAALVTGNTVLFKPAEQTPGIAYRLVQILLEAGVPPGALAFLPGVGEEVGADLVTRPEVSFVTFTGSAGVGLSIIEHAAVHQPGQAHVKRVVAEMGGKNAIVVDTDADLDQAVPAIVGSAFGYAGQKCSAASRVIGLGPIFEELVDRLAGASELVVVGHPRELRTSVGPVIDEDAWKRVRRYQEAARVEGEVRLQRNDLPDGGWYVGPTLMVTDDPRCRVATEEIFGPVLVAMRADDFDHALDLAGSTDYALTGGLFSRSPARIARAAEEFRAGNLYVNRGITGALVGRQPFGGFGLSGVGSKAGGPDYLLQFVEPKVLTENTIRQGFAPSESG
ncbi:MAG: RHH-type transcriptional regulator, proline utilization regulon repressor / proline dehydrogenase, partial [Actinomycetota bacterium]|nr:RHH-type transcriptional regulator, proline utilization regulon repressor / proline dehydrogenase [Actinomycetota bacterium]